MSVEVDAVSGELDGRLSVLQRAVSTTIMTVGKNYDELASQIEFLSENKVRRGTGQPLPFRGPYPEAWVMILFLLTQSSAL